MGIRPPFIEVFTGGSGLAPKKEKEKRYKIEVLTLHVCQPLMNVVCVLLAGCTKPSRTKILFDESLNSYG